jgi:hypothetical protein
MREVNHNREGRIGGSSAIWAVSAFGFNRPVKMEASEDANARLVHIRLAELRSHHRFQDLICQLE